MAVTRQGLDWNQCSQTKKQQQPEWNIYDFLFLWYLLVLWKWSSSNETLFCPWSRLLFLYSNRASSGETDARSAPGFSAVSAYGIVDQRRSTNPRRLSSPATENARLAERTCDWTLRHRSRARKRFSFVSGRFGLVTSYACRACSDVSIATPNPGQLFFSPFFVIHAFLVLYVCACVLRASMKEGRDPKGLRTGWQTSIKWRIASPDGEAGSATGRRHISELLRAIPLLHIILAADLSLFTSFCLAPFTRDCQNFPQKVSACCFLLQMKLDSS